MALEVALTRPGVPGEDAAGEPFSTTLEVDEGTTLSALAARVAESGYLPGLPGDGDGLIWTLKPSAVIPSCSCTAAAPTSCTPTDRCGRRTAST